MKKLIILLFLAPILFADTKITRGKGGEVFEKATADADYVNVTGDTMTGPLTTLAQNWSFKSVSIAKGGSTEAAADDLYVAITVTGIGAGSATYVLPAASGAKGRVIIVRAPLAAIKTVLVNTKGGDTIAQASAPITMGGAEDPGEVIAFISDGVSEWSIAASTRDFQGLSKYVLVNQDVATGFTPIYANKTGVFRVDVPHTAWTAAGLTEEIVVATIPAGANVDFIYGFTSAKFAGTAWTDFRVDAGHDGTLCASSSAYYVGANNLTTFTVNTANGITDLLAYQQANGLCVEADAYNITLTGTSTGGNLNASTAGNYVLVFRLHTADAP